MDTGSAAALYAGSILVKKTFEAVAQRSLSSLFTRLQKRFQGQHQLQNLQKELQLRLQVLSLPVDMCLQYALHGNTALQGALDMALHVINDIISFQEELEVQAYNESVVKVSQIDAAARLQGFMTRLDAILPYLSLAVNAVSLLKESDAGLSPSRLMEATQLIRTANNRQGTVTSIRAKLYKFETRLTLPRWQEKMTACQICLRHSSTLAGLGVHEFELFITDEEESDSADPQTCMRLPISDIAAVGSSSLHVLGLGEHELEAVLLVDISVSSSGRVVDTLKKGPPSTPLQAETPGRTLHYAFQCLEEDDGDETEESCLDVSSNHGGKARDDEHGVDGNDQDVGSILGSKILKLGVMEYTLRLCMLQAREEKEHWLLSDERIGLFFRDPRYMSEPLGNIQKPLTQAGGGTKTPSKAQTPTPRKKTPLRTLSNRTPVGASRALKARSNISDLFYDLRLESPGGSNSS